MPKPLNCLIVDDDPMYSVVASSILASLTTGFIETAGSGSLGLEKLRGSLNPVDLVFLDLNMPDVDGLAFMRAAAEAGYWGHVVISSGESNAVLRSAEAMGKMLGISLLGTLKKPLTVESVADILDRSKIANAKPAFDVGDGATDFELTPYYQPQYQLQGHRLVGFEALIRLTAKDGQVSGPNQLFANIKQPGELASISLAIAEKVLTESQDWLRRGGGPDISINFDASVLEMPDVVLALQDHVKKFNVVPDRLCLEVTEKSLPKDPSRLVESLTRLRMAGFRLSLDDYGMGASSFELLRLCPFSEIKVDRSIIAACTTDHVTRKFLHAVAGLARDLELASVAEGVETREELAEVEAAGMQRVQGFLFSRPVPPYQAIDLIGETL
ncbi:EAL domain-containing response regulator [Pararhizobium arenae]|uniref:EAL domain-containing response regulator n=1 Tax=Pararhizobium arenae TaxID=1856850 RepID=UPI00094B5CB5|nr:EAL domain-containing response regulator [Pararhizobium arenae]